eukprot:TRINITY_DN51765_c0_g1_i2.p1 TRINITY_DN51765_c0_g1~~TRINITY_DN51765_c0_g1_i2.p1  ORF type:complete len:160 (+),score=4.22 TRINITY_DN51765_c0_g1_i2:33-512(+)
MAFPQRSNLVQPPRRLQSKDQYRQRGTTASTSVGVNTPSSFATAKAHAYLLLYNKDLVPQTHQSRVLPSLCCRGIAELSKPKQEKGQYGLSSARKFFVSLFTIVLPVDNNGDQSHTPFLLSRTTHNNDPRNFTPQNIKLFLYNTPFVFYSVVLWCWQAG